MPETITERTKSSPHFTQHLKLSPFAIRKTRSGCKNKIPADIQAGVVQVYEQLGGVKGLLAWAMDNPDCFYGQILVKLLPKDVSKTGIDGLKVYIYGEQVNVSTPNHQPVTIESALSQITQAGPQAAAQADGNIT